METQTFKNSSLRMALSTQNSFQKTLAAGVSFPLPSVTIERESLQEGFDSWICHCGFKIPGKDIQRKALTFHRHHAYCLLLPSVPAENLFTCNYPGCFRICTHEGAQSHQNFLQQLGRSQDPDEDVENPNIRMAGDIFNTYTPHTTSSRGFETFPPSINVNKPPTNTSCLVESPPTTFQPTLCSSNFYNSSPALTINPEIPSSTSLPDKDWFSQKPSQLSSEEASTIYGILQKSQSNNLEETPSRSTKRKPKQPSFASMRYTNHLYPQPETSHTQRTNESSSPIESTHQALMPTTSDHSKRRRMDSQDMANSQFDPQTVTYDLGNNSTSFSTHETPSVILNPYDPQHTSGFPITTREDELENPNQDFLYSPIPLYYELLQHLERP